VTFESLQYTRPHTHLQVCCSTKGLFYPI